MEGLQVLTVPQVLARGLIWKSTPVYQYPFATTAFRTLEEGNTVQVSPSFAGWIVVQGGVEGRQFVGFCKESDVAVEKDQMKQSIQIVKTAEARSGPSLKFPVTVTLASGTDAMAFQNVNGFYRIQQGTWIKVDDTRTIGKPQPMNWNKYIPWVLGGAAVMGTLWIVLRERKNTPKS